MGSIIRILLVSINILLALFIFQNGFLLKRQEILSKSSCSDAHAQPGQTCWMKQQYQRVILILVDALRYDFLIPIDENTKKSKEEWYYRGQMKNIEKLVKSGNVSIGTLLADPPTTTLQRLKALTTGTLPTFIDAGDNFSPDAVISEDSFVYQAAQLGKNVTLLGDDTWLSLFPNQFSKTAAYDSFDINDLNTVDDKIAPILQDEMLNSNSSIIIAHFLGVDHCGHKFGPSHPVMADTLRKMDRIIGQTIETMKSDDLLIVIGDHGMTSTGDHGGESENEIRAGILVHSKKHQIILPERPIHQIDIVPTISLLMGLPIPFSNLGTVITQLFTRDLWEIAVGMNYEQVKRFAETYAAQKNFGELHSHTIRDSNTMEEQLDTMSRIQTLLRVSWTQFDDAYINAGIFSLVEAIMFLITNEVMSLEWIIYRTGCGLLQAALLTDKTDSDGSARTLLLMTLAVSCLSSIISMCHKALQIRISIKSMLSAKVIGPILVIIHSISLFSNSYVVYEAQVVRYFLQSLVTLVFLEKLRSTALRPRKPFKLNFLWKFVNQDQNLIIFTLIMVGLRSEPIFHRCREEEVGCDTYYPSRQAGSLTRDAQVVRLLFALGSLAVANLSVFKYYGLRDTKSQIESNSKRSSETIRILSATSWLHIAIIVLHSVFASLTHDVSRANLSAHSLSVISLICAVLAWREGNSAICAHFLLMPVYILFGDGLIPAIIIFIAVSVLIAEFVSREFIASTIALLIPLGFYHLGHSPVISSIPWNAAFVGIPGGTALRVLPALFVLFHLNFSAISSIFVISSESESSQKMSAPNTAWTLTETLVLMTIRATLTCLVSSIHRRHLMVWKIFAPKFIFECILTIVFIFSANFFLIYRQFFGEKFKNSEAKINKLH